MNFLSHYYVALHEEEPEYVASLTIPDLTRGFSRIYNSVICKALPPESEALLSIQRGIQSHYEADKIFHNSPLFMQQVAGAIQSFMKEGISRERLRLSVIAHLTIELLIDRQIVVKEEKVCAKFYSMLDLADEMLLGTYFKYHNIEIEKRIFLTNFLSFKERRHLFLLKDLEKVVFVLDRIYGSVTGDFFTEEEKVKFLTAINNIDIKMRYRWKDFLKL